MCLKYVVVLFVCDLTIAQDVNDTGSPAGLMADCPGMNRSTVLSEETVRSLYVIAAVPERNWLGSTEKRCKLTQAGALCAAKVFDFRKRKTQVVISGYMDASFSPLIRSTLSQYLAMGRNVLILEIFPILVRTYPVAARVTKPFGRLFGDFLATLTEHGLSTKHLEIVGASLGAHIASYASERLQQLTGKKPYRLTALDPAGPCFRSMPAEERLNPTAAHRVDVLHTNIDGFGIAEPLGHVDFYANGGEYQPSMVANFILPCFLFCSHVRSALYWIMSIQKPDKFIAVQCRSVAKARKGDCYGPNITSNVLGLDTDFTKPGIYYLPTSEASPYYIGEKGLQKRKYDVNEYLLKPAPDEDMVI